MSTQPRRISVSMRLVSVLLCVLAVIVPSVHGAEVTITWWSHWANEPSKRQVIEKIAADYEAAHPDVNIEVTWWDKNPLRDAIRSTMTAGKGAPDITTFDTEVVEWVTAGWLLNLQEALPWENFIPATHHDGRYPGTDGIYKFNIGFKVDMILYNRELFAKLGIKVPVTYQFTQAAFIDVVKTCRAAGYAGVADAIGNRPYPARFIPEDALVNLVGIEEFGTYIRGERSWDTPEVRQVLQWTEALTKAGVWPDTFATMTIDEYHVYFHTQQKACMLYNPTWYTGRAFKPVKEGGQSPDFHFGLLRYPKMDGARANNVLRGGFESGYAILSSTSHAKIAKDILRFASQPKYGALWVAVTNSPTAIKYDAKKDMSAGMGDNPWQWYWDEFNKVYGAMEVGVTAEGSCGSFNDALKSALNEGLPLGLLTVDDVIQTLNAGLCKK